MPLSGASGGSEGWFSWFVCLSLPEAWTLLSPCPEASATSPSAAGWQTPATSGSGSPAGSGQQDAGWQSEEDKKTEKLD